MTAIEIVASCISAASTLAMLGVTALLARHQIAEAKRADFRHRLHAEIYDQIQRLRPQANLHTSFTELLYAKAARSDGDAMEVLGLLCRIDKETSPQTPEYTVTNISNFRVGVGDSFLAPGEAIDVGKEAAERIEASAMADMVRIESRNQ